MIPKLCKNEKPTPFERVMTFSVSAARSNGGRLPEGVAILSWDGEQWCDDNGERALFQPLSWWPIEVPSICKEAYEAVAKLYESPTT